MRTGSVEVASNAASCFVQRENNVGNTTLAPLLNANLKAGKLAIASRSLNANTISIHQLIVVEADFRALTLNEKVPYL